MTATYLDEILTWHRLRAAGDTRDWRSRVGEVVYDGPSLFEALANDVHHHVKVIAEVKRRSPSKGLLRNDLSVEALARAYATGGAAAISVLTDSAFFAGSSDDLKLVRQSVRVPVLRKDFTVSANDVLDTAAMGASAVLLIVAALTDDELAEFLVLAETCGLDALVEVHDEDEGRRAVDAGATIIGINQRDLHTFEVDTDRATAIIGSLPTTVLSVCESGLASVNDVARVALVGFDAVLVGEAFVRSESPELTVHDFSRIERVERG